jgi:hypothetical protein
MAAAALEVVLADEAATTRLGADLARALKPGDLVALEGDLGAGKSTLARGLIRTLAGDDALDVPSPTFTIVQTYDLTVPVSHFDLYRLNAPAELDELGLDEALAGIVLVEWPEKAGDRLPTDRIRVSLAESGQGRVAKIFAPAAAAARIARPLDIRDFLRTAGWGEAVRRPLAGDASARSYETVTLGAEARIVMNSPPLVLGPAVRDGKAYAEIAHTARDVSAFVAIDRALAGAGIAVPTIYAHDLARGLLLIENLGSGSFLDAAGRPVAARYAAAAELLTLIHARRWEPRIEAAPGVFHTVPHFDRAAMLIEADLLIEWYLPYVTGSAPTDALRAAYRGAWDSALDRLAGGETTLMLRDYHSPNIIWREERTGHDRLGIIDFQDALIGPAAYDVASLAMDARVDVSRVVERSTVAAYVAARKAAGGFDENAFALAYATMAAQRNSKILGIFVRLDRRDGKPQYLRHLPRIQDYLRRAFEHPGLAALAAFYREAGLLRDAGR